jgi:AcrR family transcriptional regulator
MTTPPATRATPMTPDDRRAAIVDAVLPLVAARGAEVTSRDLAAAAGVAEGTLFRAFGDKRTLVGAVAYEGLHRASGPEATRAELAGIDPADPLEDRLTAAIELGRARMAEVVRWMSVLRSLHERAGDAPDPTSAQATELRARLLGQRELQRNVTVHGLQDLLRPDAHRLRVPVDVAVAVLEASIAGTHGRIDRLTPAPPARVVADVLVHGLVSDDRRPSAPDVPPAPADAPAPGSGTPHPEEP